MVNVSSIFLEKMQERTDFFCHAEVTLGNGEVLRFGPDQDHDLVMGNNGFTDGAEAEGFPLGVAVCRSMQIEVLNDDEGLSDVDFFGARVRLSLSFDLDDSVESVELGTFTVNSPAGYGDTVIIEALDDMWKADTAYESDLMAPVTLSALFADVCEKIGVPIHSATFRNSDFVVNEIPQGYTCRDLLGYIAMIAGGNARISRHGYMEILEYNFDMIGEGNADIFTPEGWMPSGLVIDTNDINITGVQMTVTAEDEEGNSADSTHLYGSNGYVLAVENPLITADPEAGLALIAASLLGHSFRKFKGEHTAHPLAEFMDPICLVDRKGRVSYSFITDISFTFGGLTSFANSSDSNLRAASSYTSPSAPAVIQAQKLVAQERTAREAQIAAINNSLANSSGLYSSTQVQEDGSAVYLLHDKPTLEESQAVIKMTAEAIGFSTDGGMTYPYAFTITGEAVLAILAAEGINADWIRAGELRADLVFGGQLQGASGTFTSLIAGVLDSQRLQLGLVEDDPTLNIYDSDGDLELSLTKTGIQLAGGVNMTRYSVGTKTGMGFFIA